jgi:hypothetical protein
MTPPAPTPPLSGENHLIDEEDVILLQDEIPPAENDLVEICQIADRSEPLASPQQDSKSPELSIEPLASINLSHAIEAADFKTGLPSNFSVTEADIKEFDLDDDSKASALSPVPKTSVENADSPMDDLQRLIDEVIHDSQVPLNDLSATPLQMGEPAEKLPADTPIDPALSLNQVDAALDRVIRSLFAERIEQILDEVITATVQQEFATLKKVLLNHFISDRTLQKVNF